MLDDATRVLAAGELEEGELRDRYGSLLEHYRKLLHQSTRLISVSDRQLQRVREAGAELERLAWQDPLTGIPNRRSFLNRAESEVRRAARYDRPLTLILFDIDGFTAFNEAHGRDSGDDLMRRLCAVTTAVLRDADHMGRIGGGEFGILLPETGIDGGRRMAERLRAKFAETGAAPDGTGPRVTASFGVAAVDPTDAGAVKAAIEAADLAVHEAKNRGRDRVEMAV
ncbi:MAG: GGDEF domain-containing protein [Hyphomicrobiales bacterium]|nr:GGDEF domain-containing protein [Hyphomicrobiales bacterium]MCP5374120.1 GGDEF domain-containing protein [Hyphomicrobiales bacterium]